MFHSLAVVVSVYVMVTAAVSVEDMPNSAYTGQGGVGVLEQASPTVVAGVGGTDGGRVGPALARHTHGVRALAGVGRRHEARHRVEI